MRKRNEIENDLTFVLGYINDSYTANPSQRGVDVGEAFGRLTKDLLVDSRDDCDVCDGTRGGTPGNENLIRVDGEFVSMCDYCHADHIKSNDNG